MNDEPLLTRLRSQLNSWRAGLFQGRTAPYGGVYGLARAQAARARLAGQVAGAHAKANWGDDAGKEAAPKPFAEPDASRRGARPAGMSR